MAVPLTARRRADIDDLAVSPVTESEPSQRSETADVTSDDEPRGIHFTQTESNSLPASAPDTPSACTSDAPMEMEMEAEPLGDARREMPIVAPYGWPSPKEFPKWYLRRITGYDQSKDSYGFTLSWDLLISFVFVCLTMVVLGLINHYGFHKLDNGTLGSFLPAFGASCTVVYSTPKASVAQPRSVLIAHVSAAIIGTALANAFRSVDRQPFGFHCAGAIGVALHMAFMMLTHTMHPPASATVISAAINPINAYYKDEGFLFVVAPVLIGTLVLLIMAWLLNNIFGHYPQYW